jgi:hypothetical protein
MEASGCSRGDAEACRREDLDEDAESSLLLPPALARDSHRASRTPRIVIIEPG